MGLHVARARFSPARAVMLATMWAVAANAGVIARLNRDMRRYVFAEYPGLEHVARLGICRARSRARDDDDDRCAIKCARSAIDDVAVRFHVCACLASECGYIVTYDNEHYQNRFCLAAKHYLYLSHVTRGEIIAPHSQSGARSNERFERII